MSFVSPTTLRKGAKKLGRPRKYRTNAERQRAYRRRLRQSVHFRSKTDEWATPIDLFEELDRHFHFDTDVCARPENAKCTHFYSPEVDGLQQNWTGVCWMNPPYGREIGAWVRKAYESGTAGATVVCLLPARTDTTWWHDYCAKGTIEFLKGRLKFGNAQNSAPFPSAVVVFAEAPQPQTEAQV